MCIIKKMINKKIKKELTNIVVLAGNIPEGINCPIGNIDKLKGKLLKYSFKDKDNHTAIDFKDAMTGKFLVRIEALDFISYRDEKAMEIHTINGFQFNFFKLEHAASQIKSSEYQYGIIKKSISSYVINE